MLVSPIEKCMDRILEGIDTGKVRLINEASGEFKAAFDKLKDSIEQTAKLVQAANIKGLIEPYQKLINQTKEAEAKLVDVAETWSWADQIELLQKPSKDSPAETMISAIALGHDSSINAIKDAMIVIAEYLEAAGKGLFTVGNQGFQMNPEFEKLVPDNFSLAMFSQEDAITKLVNIDPNQYKEEGEDALQAAIKDKYKPLHGDDENKWKELQTTLKLSLIHI